jgi:hemerythrin superfamily protein
MFSVRAVPLKLRQCSRYYSPFFAKRTIQQALAMSTISEAITKDHRELEQYYNEVINNQNDQGYQERYGNQFVWELARHSVAEELVVYPAMEKYLGKDMAESDRKDHAVVSSNSYHFQYAPY